MNKGRNGAETKPSATATPEGNEAKGESKEDAVEEEQTWGYDDKSALLKGSVSTAALDKLAALGIDSTKMLARTQEKKKVLWSSM